MQDLRLGWLAFDSSTTTGAGQVALGLGALSAASGAADSSVFIGASAGYQQSATANAATFIGKDAATNNSGTLNTTVGVGHGAFAGFGGTTAFDAVAIGNQALNLFTGTDAVGTVAIGAYSAARSSAPFGLSVCIGDTAGYQNSGAVDNSVAIGNQALANNSGAFQQGVAIGYNAQINNATPLTNVVALGAVASVTKNNQMALGKNITDYVFNNVNYTFPGSSALGSLTNDGSGNLGWHPLTGSGQTPWLTNIDGNGFALYNATNVSVIDTVLAGMLRATNGGTNWLGGITTIDGNTIFSTNTFTMAPDFDIAYGRISTNASFTFLLPLHVDKNKDQTTVMTVQNTLGTPIQATEPANVHVVPGSVMWITNVTKFTFNQDGFDTNIYAVPTW